MSEPRLKWVLVDGEKLREIEHCVPETDHGEVSGLFLLCPACGLAQTHGPTCWIDKALKDAAMEEGMSEIRLWVGVAGCYSAWVIADTPHAAWLLLEEHLGNKAQGIYAWHRMFAAERFEYIFADTSSVEMSAQQWSELYRDVSTVLMTAEDIGHSEESP